MKLAGGLCHCACVPLLVSQTCFAFLPGSPPQCKDDIQYQRVHNLRPSCRLSKVATPYAEYQNASSSSYNNDISTTSTGLLLLLLQQMTFHIWVVSPTVPLVSPGHVSKTSMTSTLSTLAMLVSDLPMLRRNGRSVQNAIKSLT